MNLHPIGCFARLAAARARRRQSDDLRRQLTCDGCCARVPEEIWDLLDSAYPQAPLLGPAHRQDLAALFAPLMAVHGWRFCACYRGRHPEHRFIFRLVDTGYANAQAERLAAAKAGPS